MLHREFNYFNTQGLSDVWNNFKYPNVSKFSELSSEEQDILKRLLEESSKKTLQAFKEIFRFQKNFRTVYNKYKHTLSEFAGVFGLDIARKTIDTKIYVRHKEQDKVYTYVIPLSLEESPYFTEVAARVYYLLRTLIDNALLYIVNEEKDFIPRTVFIDKTNEAKYTEIAGKVRSYVMPNFGAKMLIKAPTGEDLEIINKELEEKFIYRMNRDIIELDALLKGQLIIS